MPRRISRPGASDVSTMRATRGRLEIRLGMRLGAVRGARDVRRRKRRSIRRKIRREMRQARGNLQNFRRAVTRVKLWWRHDGGRNMDDPALWLSFGATVTLGYLLLAAILRRQVGARRMPRHGRGP